MFIYLRILKLLNIVTGKEHMDPPEFERPTLAEIRDARANREQYPNRYKNLLRKARCYEEYEVYTEKRDISMGILASSLNDEAAIEFLRDENDVMEPSELFKNIDDYFLYNTEVIIQNLKNEVKDMKLEKGMSMEALGKQMKVVYYYLHVLGKGEDPDAKKTNLANSILRDPQVDAPRKSLIMQILSADYYDEMSFDQMINKIKHIEQYTMKNVASVSKVAREEEQKTATESRATSVTAEVSDYERTRARDEPAAAANSAESYHKPKNMKFKGRCNKCGGVGHVATDCPSVTVDESRTSRKPRGRDESYEREKKQSHKKRKSDKNKSSRRDDSDDDADDSAGYVREYDDGDSVDD